MWALFLRALSGTAVQAEVKMPGVFANGMVLQQKQPVPVWGWVDAGNANYTLHNAGDKSLDYESERRQ